VNGAFVFEYVCSGAGLQTGYADQNKNRQPRAMEVFMGRDATPQWLTASTTYVKLVTSERSTGHEKI